MQSAPPWYIDWRSTVGFDDVEYGVGGIRLHLPDEIPDGQVGYAVSDDWRADWIVIGYETACGDPIFASDVAPHPVFTAIHGEGSWNAKLVAPSIAVFASCLRAFRDFAVQRGSPVELEASSPTPEEQSAFLETIGALAGSDKELLNFWAVQIEVDLEAI